MGTSSGSAVAAYYSAVSARLRSHFGQKHLRPNAPNTPTFKDPVPHSIFEYPVPYDGLAYNIASSLVKLQDYLMADEV